MKIAVFRALQLGDLLCAVPALRALRRGLPQARISLIGLPWAETFASRFRRYLDDFVAFPGHPGLPESLSDPQALAHFFNEVQKREYDLALQMHGSGEISNGLVLRMGARRVAGCYRPGGPCPDPASFVAWRDGEHEVRRWLRLIAQLGIAPQGTALEFPLAPEDWREWAGFGLQAERYAVVHPGSQLASRRWPPERFAAVADALAADGLQIVLTGTADEKTLTGGVSAAMRAAARDLAGATTLGGLGALVARARLVVANDTGISHIAAALETPSVIVASGSDPQRWAPLDRALHRVLAHEVACRPCAHAACPIGHPCALGVAAARVIDEARHLTACVA